MKLDEIPDLSRIAAAIAAYADALGLNEYELAALTGLPRSTLRERRKPDWDPRLSTLHALQSALVKHARRSAILANGSEDTGGTAPKQGIVAIMQQFPSAGRQ